MATFCRICDHEKRREIDAALATGEPYMLVAKRFRLPVASILSHRGHLAETQESKRGEEIAGSDVSLLARMTAPQEKCLMITLLAGEAANDLGTLCSAVGQVRKNLELLGEIARQLHDVLLEHQLRPTACLGMSGSELRISREAGSPELPCLTPDA